MQKQCTMYMKSRIYVPYSAQNRDGVVNMSAKSYKKVREFLFWLDIDENCLAPAQSKIVYEGVNEMLHSVQRVADVVVCSKEGVVALKMHWQQWRLPSPDCFLGAKLSSESALLKTVLTCGYQHRQVLVVGSTQDAMVAAQQSNVLCYPILRGRQAISWERLLEEGLDKWLHRSFSDTYQQELYAAQTSMLHQAGSSTIYMHNNTSKYTY